MMKLLAIVLIVLLAACAHRGPNIPPSKWRILYSSAAVGNYMRDEGGGKYSFNFPTDRAGIHYVIAERSKPLSEAASITMRFSIAGDGTDFTAADGGTASVRLMIEQRGDTLLPGEEDKRWWSAPVRLRNGSAILSARLTDQWTNVNGKPNTERRDAFLNCLENVGYIGFTFGGTFAGHGVSASEPVKFTLESFDD